MIVLNKDKLPLKDLPADEIKAILNSESLECYSKMEWKNSKYPENGGMVNIMAIYRTKPLSPSERLEAEKERVLSKIRDNLQSNDMFFDVSKPMRENLFMLIQKQVNSITLGDEE